MTGDEAAIRQALLDYGASFTAFDVARIANHFHELCTLVTALHPAETVFRPVP